MESDKKLETLEEELKLMKGELKQSLASVRDYLLNMELPSSEFSTILAALGDDGSQKITMKGSLGNKEESPPKETLDEESESLESEAEAESESEAESEAESESESPSEEDLTNPEESSESETELSPEDELTSGDENLESEEELPLDEETGEEDESIMPESELPAEEEQQMEQPMEQQMEREKINTGVSQSIPKVNLLANLINWVARAKKEIGYEQMPIFLEVYGISGHLTPELKEVILHMSDVSLKPMEDSNTAEVWSELMLSLHGILTGGDAPLYPLKPSWDDGDGEIPLGKDEATEAEVDKPKDMPLKLKLVFPDGDGKSKEFCLDLRPEADNNGS